jgi:tetratricopeptide (TPR) repeat protein
LLLQTLLKYRASPAEIAAFVQESLELFPNNLLFVKTQAHLYVQQKNFAAAVSLLERIDSNTVDDPAYLALLAAGYQQQQQFARAEPIYRRLTELQADKAEYWLGLAMNQDKLNQTQAAAESYRQALDKNTLNAEVVSYIKQRLDALN